MLIQNKTFYFNENDISGYRDFITGNNFHFFRKILNEIKIYDSQKQTSTIYNQDLMNSYALETFSLVLGKSAIFPETIYLISVGKLCNFLADYFVKKAYAPVTKMMFDPRRLNEDIFKPYLAFNDPTLESVKFKFSLSTLEKTKGRLSEYREKMKEPLFALMANTVIEVDKTEKRLSDIKGLLKLSQDF